MALLVDICLCFRALHQYRVDKLVPIEEKQTKFLIVYVAICGITILGAEIADFELYAVGQLVVPNVNHYGLAFIRVVSEH